MSPLRYLTVFGFLSLAALFILPATALGEDEVKAELSSYLIASPHTAEECLAALDEFAASSKNALDNWYWGCMDGDHTGYEIVHASSKTEALKAVPKNLREKAKATGLNKFTAEQVASLHKMYHEKK